MSILVVASVALLLAATALAVCARLLLGPLDATLRDLCGEAHRAEFWTRMVATCMVGETATAALMGAVSAPPQPALAAASLLRWTLIGIAVGLAAVVAVVGAFTRRGTPPPAYGAGRPLSAGGLEPGGADGGIRTLDRPLTRRALYP
jgi:hypothetical protein